MGKRLLAKRLLCVSLAVLLVSLTAFYGGASHNARNAASPVVRTAQLFPPGPLVFVSPGSIVAMTVGKTFSVQIKVNNMSQFSGWDILVYADPSVLNATSLSITGNDFAVNASAGIQFELIHCINGKGSGCNSLDGPGITHSALQDSGIVSGNGLLFTVTYKVVSSTLYFSTLAIENDLITDPNSGNSVPHTTWWGTYGFGAPVTSSAGGGGARPLPA